MSKKYQVRKKGTLSFAGIMVGWLVFVLLTLRPIFQAWGTVWWIDASGLTLILVTVAVFAFSSMSYLGTSTLKLEVDSVGLREKNWRGSWLLPWAEVTAWSAIEVGEGGDKERLIRLKSIARAEPFEIDPILLVGKQFAEIYHEIETHCGAPRPGAELLDENDGEPFHDVRI